MTSQVGEESDQYYLSSGVDIRHSIDYRFIAEYEMQGMFAVHNIRDVQFLGINKDED